MCCRTDWGNKVSGSRAFDSYLFSPVYLKVKSGWWLRGIWPSSCRAHMMPALKG